MDVQFSRFLNIMPVRGKSQARRGVTLSVVTVLIYFHQIWGFSVLSGVIVENLFFFTLVKFYKCCITLFSIQDYSSLTCVMCRVSSQYKLTVE